MTLVNGKIFSQNSKYKKCYIYCTHGSVLACVCVLFFWSLTMISSKQIQIELDDLIQTSLHAYAWPKMIFRHNGHFWLVLFEIPSCYISMTIVSAELNTLSIFFFCSTFILFFRRLSDLFYYVSHKHKIKNFNETKACLWCDWKLCSLKQS